MIGDDVQRRIVDRARLAGLAISKKLASSLGLYFRLLAKWNQKINLSGLDLDSFDSVAVDRLLIEPLVAASHVTAPSAMIDVGSGGGSPAIPMALAFGAVELLMVESKSRKAVFLQEAIRHLQMKDARVASVRYETLLSDPHFREHFDLLTVRAVKTPVSVLSEIQWFVKPGGSLMLFRSDTSGDFRAPPSLRLARSYPLLGSLRSHIEILKRPD